MQLFRKLLFPISLVYGLVVFLRNKFFDWGLFSSKSFKTLTICVGNVSVGGTGKTPMIEFLIRSLLPTHRIAVLSRGYKRTSKGFLLADEHAEVATIGDEPFQIKAKFPQVSVAVDTHRANGIAQLEKRVKPDVILLDDAYQHRKVTPSYNMLLTVFNSLYIDDWYLPTGNLRDSKKASERANIIVVTKCPKDLSIETQTLLQKRINPKKHQKVIFSYLAYNPILKGNGSPLKIENIKDKNVTLVTGIANPAPLISYLEECGIGFEHLEFRDHHFFSAKEIAELKEKEFVLTTEKDFVRLKNDLRKVYYLEVSHQFLANGDTVLAADLKPLLSKN